MYIYICVYIYMYQYILTTINDPITIESLNGDESCLLWVLF